ncbi:39S ribosomal protein L42, mitochondrial [Orussus abietinus]|uniref:39S ribosomal protein L42, mitochondrial n=1 Tax=Orussus abietinus TaxID=222816 RepID=UPI000625C335|nr:39S ribosomal protein L42, mitochondrial [Orussus abietinus]
MIMNRGVYFLNLLKRTFVQRNVNYSMLPSQVVVVADDDTIVCWHPEETFPYECSKPLPEAKPGSNSVLKIGENEINSVFRKVNPELAPQMLAKITFTTKHRWYPRSRDRKAKKTEPNRPYL